MRRTPVAFGLKAARRRRERAVAPMSTWCLRALGADMGYRRVALTPEQIDAHSLKSADNRAWGYTEGRQLGTGRAAGSGACRPLSETQSRRCCRGTSRTGSGRTGTTVTGCTTWRPHLTEVGRECPPGLPRSHPARYPGRRDRHANGRSGALSRPRRWRSGITVRRGSRGGTAEAAPRNWRWPSCSTGPATRAGRPVTIRRSGATWWPVGPGRGMGRSRWRGSAPVEAVDAWLGERK